MGLKGGRKLKLTPNLTKPEFHLGVNFGYTTKLGKSRSFRLYQVNTKFPITMLRGCKRGWKMKEEAKRGYYL